MFKFTHIEFNTQSAFCGVVYYPVLLHLQECLECLGYKKGDFPESEKASRKTLVLPIFSELKTEQQEFVVQKISEFFGEKF